MDFRVEEAADHLARTPRILDAWLRDLPEEWLHRNEGGDSWSPFDVLGHLIHGERTDWIGRARIILEGEGERRFEPFDRFAQYEASRGRGLDELLAEFANLRARNVRILRELEANGERLERTGVHPALGEVTLRQLLSTWVVHDWNHLAQIARVLASQLEGSVGPWREYLPVLARDAGTPWDTRDRGR